MIAHRDNQHRLRTITCFLIERPRTFKIKTGRIVNIGNIDRLSGNRHMRGNMGVIRRTIGGDQFYGRPGHFIACSAHVQPQRFILNNSKLKFFFVVRHHIKRAAIGVRDGARFG